ncbi:hypothetical protein ONS95_010658 [Cadophora gregata]|uniref:uncharacterized protein n=1 Tax=Cadophora gregata TaxID=51156 RepID=UPI0026DDC6D2|nr:uncharacterized protein ONS95_010658 [Cadophora gregata]KAK0122422.1 hypothetical protein ONS95_010658 [Cadophora gregata]KAK0127899.1 hypothetical protein ONS96_007399 [Cadophora gregata f. sp. sojae]
MGLPLDEFTFFAELPMEIRLVIWRFAFPRSRNIKLDFDVNAVKHNLSVGALSNTEVEIEARCPLPVTLYVNSESRKETLKHYTIFKRHQEYSAPKVFRPLCYSATRDIGHTSYSPI